MKNQKTSLIGSFFKNINFEKATHI